MGVLWVCKLLSASKLYTGVPSIFAGANIRFLKIIYYGFGRYTDAFMWTPRWAPAKWRLAYMGSQSLHLSGIYLPAC